eukprot:COSAG01_NODE_32794_length_575_cov_0.974790_1_plen_94_part_00
MLSSAPPSAVVLAVCPTPTVDESAEFEFKSGGGCSEHPMAAIVDQQTQVEHSQVYGVRVAVPAGGFEYSMRAMFAGAPPLRTPIQGNTSVTVV